MELVPLIIAAVAYVIGKSVGPVTNLISEWRQQYLCRDIYDDAVKQNKDFDPVEMIKAARGERASPPAEAPRLAALPAESGNKLPKKKAG